MVVYICSPYRGIKSLNVEMARRLCRKATMEGKLVFCPHLFYPQFLDDDDPREREMALQQCRTWLRYADEVWVLEGTISDGMAQEICEAIRLGIPIKTVRKG